MLQNGLAFFFFNSLYNSSYVCFFFLPLFTLCNFILYLKTLSKQTLNPDKK